MVLLLSTACTDDSPRDPIGGGGSAGASGASGASGTGGSAGTSDSGGTGGTSDSGGAGGGSDGPDASVPRVQAVIDAEYVRLSAVDPIWVRTCGESLTLLQQVDGAWVPLQDDRPVASNLQFRSHYVDETYAALCRESAGCDLAYCRSINDPVDSFEEQARLIPRELVQVGDYAAPTCERGDAGVPFDAGVDVDAGIQRVPALESRAPRGPLVVRVRYHTDSHCDSAGQTMDVPVE
jgi:hypothetical protein